MKNNYKYVAHLDMLGMTEAIRCNANEAWGALSDLRLSENNIIRNRYYWSETFFELLEPNNKSQIDNTIKTVCKEICLFCKQR